jgi:hypothetical protein
MLLFAFSLVGCSPAPVGRTFQYGQCIYDPETVVGDSEGTPHDFVVTSLTLPQQRSDFAYDLDCDGRTDNQLGSIVAALVNQETDPQGPIDQAINSGDLIALLRVTAEDLHSAQHAGATWLGGKPAPQPVFTGAGHFTVDDSIPESDLFGPIFQGSFTSNPVGVSPPIALPLRLRLPNATVTLPLEAAHIQFAVDNGHVTGQVNGVMRAEELAAIVLPAFAALFTQQIHDDPAAHLQLQSIFDTGGCSDDGVPAKANDNVITLCELLQNQIIQNIFSDDITLFDPDGTYDPQPGKKPRDSLSIGVGFTAVQASF